MDALKYRAKMMDRKTELLNQVVTTDIDKAILDLELIICDIGPYSRYWRYGYIRSLRLAIAALKEHKERSD